jgi:hypothetical protein
VVLQVGPNARVRKRSALSARHALKIGTEIYRPFLDSCSLNWTSIDPIAFSNAGETKLFCPLMWIGVLHESLLFDAVVRVSSV